MQRNLSSKEPITMVFRVEPVPKGRPRFTVKGFAYTPKETRDAEDKLRWLMRSQWKGQPLEGALKVSLIFSLTKPKSVKKRLMPTVKPDLDNLIKILDCGNKIIWNDDAQIVELSARKEYGLPFIQLEVSEL